MGTTLATKSDLLLLEQKLDARCGAIEHRLEAFRDALQKDNESLRSSVQKDMELLRGAMTMRLGSMLMVGLTLLFAALKLT